MRLIDALKLAREASTRNGEAFRVLLVCGYTPLHSATFLAAHTGQRMPSRKIEVETGSFGAIHETLSRATQNPPSAVAVILEWVDFDPRLSPRQAPGASGLQSGELAESVRGACVRLRDGILGVVAAGCPVVLSLPTLRKLEWSHYPTSVATPESLAIDAAVAEFAQKLAAEGCRVIPRHLIDERSPLSGRHDLRSELQAGFPYSLSHAQALTSLVADAIALPVPKKAIITDLDNTLWDGIVGEVGPENVGWTLDTQAAMHAHYQQTLASLAVAGVLIGIASKNDAEIAGRALDRADMVIARKHLFPVEIHWNDKSESVRRILHSWNIGADSVVFVDDSSLELAEVARAFPSITCLRYPHDGSPEEVLALTSTLRDLCGRPHISAEDRIRSSSLVSREKFLGEAENTGDKEAFLAGLGATIAFDTGNDDPRALELINKTNQFNMHGLRYDEDEWRRLLLRPGAFVWTVSYEDRFGPLGKIAVLAGEVRDRCVFLRDMVLSCRAFSRRVEDAALTFLFDYTGADTMELRYRRTDRNGPAREFLARITGLPADDEAAPVLTAAAFRTKAAPLYHEIRCKLNV